MYCVHCGTKVSGAFCAECGRPTGPAAASSSGAQPRNKRASRLWRMAFYVAILAIAFKFVIWRITSLLP